MPVKRKLPAKLAARIAQVRAAAAQDRNGITSLEKRVQALELILGELVEDHAEAPNAAAPK